MADGQDLIQLYSRRILALAADLPHAERLDAPDGSATKRSPLCGSTVTVDVTLDGDRIAGFGQDVKACALGQASASVLGGAVIGRTRDEIAGARDALKAMLKQGGEPPAVPFDGLEALRPAAEYKNRHASILLAWDATLGAIDAAAASAHARTS
ncbi:iron-sulfur cluster assembly scaffold protein [Rubrimonas cliftonensis]|uniref:NifU homolog involved in Fe-S cluster formation n=1 Tax=Rubrimonas cliftonensis TaxID=89524 RepID=A0A1H3VSP6_9RHOB|nr:iron-sulfur cluster assembly scaffold protein [Rubrimonas cliftonensis]SDZ77790.1 NifU homolog involved in Fe-S cluster formation [Rubrimonas cliftonensis]